MRVRFLPGIPRKMGDSVSKLCVKAVLSTFNRPYYPSYFSQNESIETVSSEQGVVGSNPSGGTTVGAEPKKSLLFFVRRRPVEENPRQRILYHEEIIFRTFLFVGLMPAFFNSRLISRPIIASSSEKIQPQYFCI